MLSPAKEKVINSGFFRVFQVFHEKHYKKYYLDLILRVTYDERKT